MVLHLGHISSQRPPFYKLDIASLLLVLAGVLWGIKQRSGLPVVPLLTPDSWGYLHPALSWLGGAGFQQTEGRDWLYPAIVALILRVGNDFSSIVRVQQCLCLAGAPLLWLSIRIWLSLFPKRSAMCHGIAVFLGAAAAAIYLLNTTQVRFELTIQPESVFAFFVLVYLVFVVAFIRARWVSHQTTAAIVFGAASLLISYSCLLLKPSWGFALIPSLILVIAGVFGPGLLSLRVAPATLGVLVTVGLFLSPHLLGFKTDSDSRTFLPFTLVSIHAAQILQNAEQYHSIGSDEQQVIPTDNQGRFYQELKQVWLESRNAPLPCPTLGFSPDYIMHVKDFFHAFESEQKLTDAQLISLCYSSYFKTWIESPSAMLIKVGKQLAIFLSAPSTDFAAHSVKRQQAVDLAARFGLSPQALLKEAESKDYLRNQPAFLAYLRNLESLYSQGWQIDCLNWLRWLVTILARLATFIQIGFFIAQFPVFLIRRFSGFRLPALAVVMISTAVYGNMLTVGIVNTLDLDRYRTSYVPALLVTLTMMTTFLFAVIERWFRHAKDSQPNEDARDAGVLN